MIRALVVTTLLAGSARAQAERVVRVTPVCVAIDETRDELAEAERAAARVTLAHVLEAADQLVVATGCEDTYQLWHERDGEHTIVHLRNSAVAARKRVSDPITAYAALARVLVEARARADLAARATPAPPSAPAPALDTDLEPLEPGTALPAPATTPEPPRTLDYVRAGFGNIGGSGGAGFALGYRRRLGTIAFDASASVAASSAATAAALGAELLVLTSQHTERTWYYGAGLGVGAMTVGMSGGGAGLQAALTAGLELPTAIAQRGFVQADLALPAFSSSAPGMGPHAPASLMISLGLASDLTR